MNAKFIKQEDVAQLYGNIEELYKQVVCSGKTVQEYLGKECVVLDTNIPIEDFSLDMSESNPVLTDLENVKRVYKAMMGLSNSQASDERIWLAYSFDVCKSYMNYRWQARDVNTIKNRWLFGYTVKRSLFRHGIARLWWIGRCTYDKSRVDPFELTAYVITKQDIINQLLDIGFNGNKELVLAIIEAIRDSEKEGKSIGREEIRSVSRFVNSLGGMYLIDSWRREEIYQRVKEIFE
ncbi:MAG: hypothetical protein HFE29_01715 [Clostridia bacterium]|jgi:hypothetical protein|nr:hypothetical protein [Clostridia bacterium]